MNKAIKAQWIEAMLSGDYKQGKSALHYKSGATGAKEFCCLGVLCDLYQKEHPETSNWREIDNSSTLYFDAKDAKGDVELGHNAYPPELVLEWADLNERDSSCLAIKNDRGANFGRIAEEIDKKH